MRNLGNGVLKKSALIGALLAASTSAFAQQPTELTPDQKGYIAYHQCLMHAAMDASSTDAKDEAIYGIAKSACAAVRSKVVVGLETNKEYLAALDAVDADKSANFPSWIKGVRERRAARDAQFAKPNNAPNQ